jgi:hypothetical protein
MVPTLKDFQLSLSVSICEITDEKKVAIRDFVFVRSQLIFVWIINEFDLCRTHIDKKTLNYR